MSLAFYKYVYKFLFSAQRSFVRSGTCMKMIPFQRNSTQQVMKLIRSNTGRTTQQVLRVVPVNKPSLGASGIKTPIQKTIIVSKAASVLQSQQPQQQMHHNQIGLGNVLNNGNNSAGGTPKLVFVQNSLQQGQITQQNLPTQQQNTYSSEGVIQFKSNIRLWDS